MSQDILDILDSEMLKIVTLHEALNRRAKDRRHNYNDFEREIREKFAAIGFTVDVNWYRYELDGVEQDGAMPEITITGRVEEKAFDPDRQVHEVTSDILGLGDKGVIRTDKETLKRFLDANGGNRQ